VVGCLLTGTARSPEFAVSLFLAMIVIYDAMGVRYETGQQAKILNAMRRREIEEGREPLFDKPLDEKMGHTLPEVIVGILVGIAASLLMCLWAAPLIDRVLP
jgi:acid phosphatase family membrane protein YuiD